MRRSLDLNALPRLLRALKDRLCWFHVGKLSLFFLPLASPFHDASLSLLLSPSFLFLLQFPLDPRFVFEALAFLAEASGFGVDQLQ